MSQRDLIRLVPSPVYSVCWGHLRSLDVTLAAHSAVRRVDLVIPDGSQPNCFYFEGGGCCRPHDFEWNGINKVRLFVKAAEAEKDCWTHRLTPEWRE